MNGDCASRASRRAISVLPTPVGPIMRMFFGATSSARSGVKRCRRYRLRNAIATASLALACRTTYLSSSATISRGVRDERTDAVDGGDWTMAMSELFNDDVRVGVDADFGGDGHRLQHDVAGAERAVADEGAGCGQGIGPARSDADDTVIRFDQVAGAR